MGPHLDEILGDGSRDSGQQPMESAVTEATLFHRIRTLDDTERTSYAERGRICLVVKQLMIHTQRMNPETGTGCSLTEWIRLAAPWGYSSCFAAMRDVEALGDIPPKDLQDVPQSNFPILMQLSTAVRSQPEVLKAAKGRKEDLYEHIQVHHPGQHIIAPITKRFTLDPSQNEIMRQTLEAAMKEEPSLMNETEAIIWVCADYWLRKIRQESEK